VVNPSHPTSFPTTKLFQQSLRASCAFGLKFSTQISEFPFNLFDFSTIIKPAVRSDSKVVYSEVNAQNNVLRTNVLLSGSNLFRECEQEKTSSFFIHSKQTFTNIPIEVLLVADRNIQFELLPYLEQSQNEDFSFDVSTSWEVIPNTCFFDDGLSFSLLDHSTSLSHTSNGNLGRELELLPDCAVNSIMQFEILSDFVFPRIINTELESLSVSFDSRNYFFSWIDSNLCSDTRSHNKVEDVSLFKCYENGL